VTSNTGNIPDLKGLVLAGGKSSRMGQDKAQMKWHGKEQHYYMADLLSEFCDEVFISCREEQQEDILSSYKTLPDNAEGKGPLVGIRSAFKRCPQNAWLVVACDLPLLDADTLRYLIDHRNTDALATTFSSPFDGLPEPLITIWEPASIAILDIAASEGFSCPRNVYRY
jgi:molybdopterin-guanine dinucleotide biosynthesis protein A